FPYTSLFRSKSWLFSKRFALGRPVLRSQTAVPAESNCNRPQQKSTQRIHRSLYRLRRFNSNNTYEKSQNQKNVLHIVWAKSTNLLYVSRFHRKDFYYARNESRNWAA